MKCSKRVLTGQDQRLLALKDQVNEKLAIIFPCSSIPSDWQVIVWDDPEWIANSTASCIAFPSLQLKRVREVAFL